MSLLLPSWTSNTLAQPKCTLHDSCLRGIVHGLVTHYQHFLVPKVSAMHDKRWAKEHIEAFRGACSEPYEISMPGWEAKMMVSMTSMGQFCIYVWNRASVFDATNFAMTPQRLYRRATYCCKECEFHLTHIFFRVFAKTFGVLLPLQRDSHQASPTKTESKKHRPAGLMVFVETMTGNLANGWA